MKNIQDQGLQPYDSAAKSLWPNMLNEKSVSLFLCSSDGMGGRTKQTNSNFAGSRSRHPGGVNNLFCDGSVHFMTDGIDVNIWRSLGWMSDGGPMGATWGE